MTYQLNITLTPDQIDAITSAKQYVAVSKQDFSTGQMANLIWAVFTPMEENNVSWEDSYLLYASALPLTEGGVIFPSKSLDAPYGGNYLWGGETFTPDSTETTSTYKVLNVAAVSWVVGLAQQNSMVEADCSPINAVSLSANAETVLTPGETVYVFLTNYGQPGTVISTVTPAPVPIVFDSVADSVSLMLNSATGLFEVQSPN